MMDVRVGSQHRRGPEHGNACGRRRRSVSGGELSHRAGVLNGIAAPSAPRRCTPLASFPASDHIDEVSPLPRCASFSERAVECCRRSSSTVPSHSGTSAKYEALAMT